MAAESYPARHAAGSRWRRLRLLLGLATILILAGLWLASRTWAGVGFRWSLFFATFRKLHPGWIAAATVFALATYLGRALRWRVFIRPQKPTASLWGLFSATAIGFTAIVLFGRPGEMVRPYLISYKERLSFSSQMAAWLLERIFDLLMALLIFGFALSQVHQSGVRVGEPLQWVLSAGGYFVGVFSLLCVAVLLGLRNFGDSAKQRIVEAASVLPDRYRYKVSQVISSFAQGMESTRDWRAVGAVLGYSVLEWLLIAASSYCMFQASPETARLGLRDVLIFVGFVSFGGIVQIPGVGGGFQIVTVVVLTELFGLPFETSTGFALALWFITFVVIMPAGLLLAFRDGLKWRTLRHIQRDR
jgi:uncharacterized protein (TIRG00374 family)